MTGQYTGNTYNFPPAMIVPYIKIGIIIGQYCCSVKLLAIIGPDYMLCKKVERVL